VRYSSAVRCLLLSLLILSLGGCAPIALSLDTRGNPFEGVPEEQARAELVTRYNELADRLQATAVHYDREVRKNHVKLRVMSVLSGVGAAGAGASVGVLSQPGLADEARPGIAAAGISGAVFAGLMAILPHAHQYVLKEAGYARQARQSWSDLRQTEAACAATVLDASQPIDSLGACLGRLEEALARARSFEDDSPCRPPPEKDLQKLLRAAGRP